MKTNEYYRIYYSKKRKEWKEKGVCTACGKPRDRAGLVCTKCGNYKKNNNHILKEKVLKAYGNKCECCGETNVKFLSIDHINGGGSMQRRSLGGNFQFFRWLIKNNFPEGYRVLCYNCNMGRAYNNDVCPHMEE